MKKTALLVFNYYFFLLSSCEKQLDDVIQDEKISTLDAELKALNGNFATKTTFSKNILRASGEVSTPDTPEMPDSPLSFKSLCAVFSADVGGAWAGTWAGGKIGGLAGTVTVPGVGTVGGAAIGATAGAIIVGGVASYAASEEVLPDSILIEHSLLNVSEPVIVTGNESAYDGHNRVLASLITSNSLGSVSSVSSSNFTNLTNNEAHIVSNYEDLIDNTLSTFSSNVSIANSKEFVFSIINDDSYLTTVSNNFFDGLHYLTTKADIIDYINEYKNYVISTSNLNSQQKTQILIALDASKGSFLLLVSIKLN